MIDIRKLTSIRVLNTKIECSSFVSLDVSGGAINQFCSAILFLQDGELNCLHGSGEIEKNIIELPKEQLFSNEKFIRIAPTNDAKPKSSYDIFFYYLLTTQLGSKFKISLKVSRNLNSIIRPISFSSNGYERVSLSSPVPQREAYNCLNTQSSFHAISIHTSGGRAETYNDGLDRLQKVVKGELSAIQNYFLNKDNINLSTWGGLGSAQHTRINEKGETETYFTEVYLRSNKNRKAENIKEVVGFDKSAFLTAFGVNGVMPPNSTIIEKPSVSQTGNGGVKLTFSANDRPLDIVSFLKTDYDGVFNQLYSGGKRFVFLPNSISVTRNGDTELVLENTAHAVFSNDVTMIIQGGEKIENG